MTEHQYDILHVYVQDERMDYETIGPFPTEEAAKDFYEKYIQNRETENYGRLSDVFFIANVGEQQTSSPEKYIEDHELCEDCGLWVEHCECEDEDDE